MIKRFHPSVFIYENWSGFFYYLIDLASILKVNDSAFTVMFIN